MDHQSDIVLLGHLNVLLERVRLRLKFCITLGAEKVQPGFTDCSDSWQSGKLGNLGDGIFQLGSSLVKRRLVRVQRDCSQKHWLVTSYLGAPDRAFKGDTNLDCPKHPNLAHCSKVV